MESNELKDVIESARIARGLSQRELSSQIGLSQSTYNDTINGKIKKVDVEILKKIAEGLDLSLEKLLEISGYKEVFGFLENDRLFDKSTKDLKELLEKYKESQLDLLDFDSQKRKVVKGVRSKLHVTIETLKEVKEDKNSQHIINEAIKDIQFAVDELGKIQEKYNYQKLPKEK